MKTKTRTTNLRQLILTALFAALIIAMTIIPYTGYISYGGVIEITTLHVIVILGACCLNAGYSAVLGGVWGLTCVIRALVYIAIPGFKIFTNPLVSFVPRVLVGVAAWAVFYGLSKTKLPKSVSAGIAAVAGSLTNTVLVLTAYTLFSENGGTFLGLLNTIVVTIGSLNGAIELALAIIIVPPVSIAINKVKDKMQF